MCNIGPVDHPSTTATLSMPATSSPYRHVWILLIGIVLAETGQALPVSASEYWVAPDGDDRLDGTTRLTAWASPSRGQPTRTSEAVPRGTLKLPVYSTAGFLDSGRLRIGKHVVAYVSRTERSFVLAGPWPENIAVAARVYDADLLGGKSFAPGDVILLAGGEFTDRPLHFCQSGAADRPITYRPAPGHRPRLVSTRFDRSPVRHLGSRRSPTTTHVVLSGLDIRNAADGNHGAPGLDLIGLSRVLVSDCRIHVSGRDINGDGRDDLYVCQPGGLPNRLFVQNADGSAAERSAELGVDWLESTHGALFVDLDNDGDQDLLAGLEPGVMIHENDGKGHFTPRTAKLLPAALPYSLAAADYDLDGDIDIYVCCYNRRKGANRHLVFARPVPYHDANNGGRNVLLRNDGRWRFSHATVRAGLDVKNRRFSYAAAWEDFDNDGDQDLYVANDFGRNNLYRNDSGRFTDIAAAAGAEDISPGMSSCWGDYDNDGWMDLYVSNMFSSAGNRITSQGRFHQGASDKTRAEFRRHARGNTLLKNLGDGRFNDVSGEAGISIGRWAWGSKFADLNNDGWEDLLVTNGFITQQDTGDL